MPVRAFPADFGFHFRRTGTMQAGDIGLFLGFGLICFFFRLLFLAFENNTAHHCFFYTHVVDVLSN